MLNRLDLRGATDVATLLPRPGEGRPEPVVAVREIIADVRAGGDASLLELTRRFDGVDLDQLQVPAEDLERARAQTSPDLVAALESAAAVIRAFHEGQLRPPHTFERDGVSVRSLTVPVRRAGLYVPGGRAAYPSTVLMTAVPARVAGAEQVVLCIPPERTTGAVAQVTLAAAHIAGVDEVYAVGGAQAIAAMAYGTETIEAVDVIAGPGNSYVAVAKREVSAVVGVPSAFAGPSEIVVVADATTPPALAAIDLIVQAEHGPDGMSWLITWSEPAADAIEAEVVRQTAEAARRDDVSATLSSGGWIVIVDGPDQAMEVANLVAPEHLQLMCADPDALVPAVRNAGAVFCGPWAPASLGDYVAGPSHVLPTHGSARYGTALTVDDFTKQVHVVATDRAGLEAVAPTVVAIAEAEGLESHARSVRMRLEVPS